MAIHENTNPMSAPPQIMEQTAPGILFASRTDSRILLNNIQKQILDSTPNQRYQHIKCLA
jgi:hypothetical protein